MGQQTITQLGDAGLKILKEAAKKFVEQNAADVAVLGADAVKAIFAQRVQDMLPALPDHLDPNLTLEQRVELGSILLLRDEMAALIATAEAQDAARVAALRSSAGSIAGAAVKSAIGVVTGLALKAVLGI